MLIYVGPTTTNAHRLAYKAGVVPADETHLRVLDLLDAPPASPDEFGATTVVLRIIDAETRAAIFRHDGTVCGFISSTTEDIGAGDILQLARKAFPTVWAALPRQLQIGHYPSIEYVPVTIKTTDSPAPEGQCEQPTAQPKSPAPSAADSSTTAQLSTPATKSPKSSA